MKLIMDGLFLLLASSPGTGSVTEVIEEPPHQYDLEGRRFHLPFLCDPMRKGTLAWAALHVSSDCGRTWQEAARASPNERNFAFEAPAHRTYWFAVQVID